MRFRFRSVAGGLVAAAAALAAAAAATTAPVHAKGFPSAHWPVRTPNATGMPDPGGIVVSGRWYSLSTGGWSATGTIKTATQAAGPWTSTGKPLLRTKPGWMADTGVWAPSIMRAADGTYVVFYAGVVSGHPGSRCIGTARGTSPAGDFTPTAHPISCWRGSGTSPSDAIPHEGSTPTSMSLIDPTPAHVGGQYVMTYKTEHRRADKRWHTTTRMVRLNAAKPWLAAANPVHSSGESIRITDSVDKYIEENPVLVQHGSTYTLFTSWGWFGRCVYTTRYRQNTSLWSGWLSKRPTDLGFPAMNVCGDGNAQVMNGEQAGSWRILFNGHIVRCEVDGTCPGHGPKGLYVGVVTWSSTGRPRVSKLLPPAGG